MFVPDKAELLAAFQRMKLKGWIHQMRNDVLKIEGRTEALNHNDPASTINVRFKPEHVTNYDPMPEFSPESKPFTHPRYKLLYANGEILPSEAVPAEASIPSETPFLRAAQQATIVDPGHLRLQNRLFESLCKRHGVAAVQREADFVDLRLTLNGEVTFFEIKTDTSAKRCIRNALGQLFEYATYPDAAMAHKWVLVGDCPANHDDICYLLHLRRQFKIPLFYAQFDWQSGNLATYV